MSEWDFQPFSRQLDLIESGCRPKGGIAKFTSGVPSLSAEQIREDGSFNFETLRFVPHEFYTSAKKGKIRRGDILVVKDGATTGKTAIVGEDFPHTEAMVNEHTFILRTKPTLLPKFAFLCLHSEMATECFSAARDHGMIGGLTQSFPDEIEIPVPPLAEQRRIVARVEALTRRLDQACLVRQAALVEIASCIRSLVAGVFTNCDEASFRVLGEVTGIIGGNSIPENAPLPGKGEERIGLMKVSDMNAPGNEQFIKSCKLETSRAAAVERRLRILPVGAVVFPKRGGAIATNKKRVLTIPAALDPNTMGVYPLPESGLISEFLLWWFESLDLAELQEDGGIPQINKKHLDPLQIPIIPEPEQRAIVARLDALRGKLDALQRLQREVEAELASFTPALLAKAFRGEL